MIFLVKIILKYGRVISGRTMRYFIYWDMFVKNGKNTEKLGVSNSNVIKLWLYKFGTDRNSR